ncbi:uncharacterized protein LOC135715020 [Ochlerotatus camptorhynchus]|uniref:uncharacterized protein LOC135715020 n=1 Tax=Ochlerotatus camptorhynchus TaxID=644619 RepID=UPI0031D0322B
MASVENKLQELLVTQHLLEIFDECGVDFVDLLRITTDQLRKSLEPTKIPWKYPVLHELISSWRTRNDSKIVSLLTSLKPGYHLRLTGAINIASSSVASTEITSESNQFDQNFSQFSSNEASKGSDSDYGHGLTSTSTTPEYVLTTLPVRLNKPAAVFSTSIQATSSAVHSKTDALDEPPSDVTCRSVETNENKHEKQTQNESQIECLITSLEPGYRLRLSGEANVVRSSVVSTKITRGSNLVNQRIYQVSSNEAANLNEPNHQLPSTSTNDKSGYFAQGFVIVTSSAHVNQPGTGYSDAIGTTSSATDSYTDALIVSLADDTIRSSESGNSLNEAEQFSRKVLFHHLNRPIPTNSPNPLRPL